MAVDVSDSEDSERSKSDRPGVTVLDQDDDRVPTEDEVLEFAEYLGIDLEKEQDLLWIAREGVVAPVPAPWKACTENGDDVFYFNFETGESIWDHPADERYRQLLEEKRKENVAASIVRTSKSASSASGAETKASADSATSPIDTTKGSSSKDTSSAVSTKKEADTNGKNLGPEPDSSVSASAEESFSASASLSVSESASTGRQRSDSKAVQGILKKETRPSLSSADSSEAKENADIPSSEWEGLAGGLGGDRLEGEASGALRKKEPPETKKLEVLPEAQKKELSEVSEKDQASLPEIEADNGLEGESSQSTPGAVELAKGIKFVDTDDDRVPTEDEVLEFAEYLGIDLEKEQDLLWIAREGVVAPVPAPWKACTENGDDVFYFNFETGESIWDHPADERYRQLLEEKRKENVAASIVRTSKSASSASGAETKASADSATSPIDTTKGSSSKDTSSAVSTKKEADTNGKNLGPEPDSSVSASAEESFSASASLSVSEPASTDKRSPNLTDGYAQLKNPPPEGMVKVGASPGVGLAGVGLGGVSLGPKPEGEKKCEASLEEIEEEDGLEGLEVLEGSSQSAPVTKVEPKGASGVAGSSASELSEDFMSEGSPNSSFLAPPLPQRARSNSVGGDTLELSVSASATGDLELPQAVQSLESDIASLARSLAVLRKVRESQREYLELLLNSNPGNP